MFLRSLIVVVLGSGLVACQSVRTTESGVVGVERSQTMLVSADQVNRSAAKAYQLELAKARRAGTLNRDPAQVARVRAIAQRLIGATAAFRADARSWSWETNIISSKELNAWVMPGGKIAVYTGLIEKLKVTDDELAAVMGHEISHALREHGRERASQAMGQGIALSVLGAAAGLSGAAMDLSQLVVDLTFNLPNSRQHETEADRIGVELAARAGYDPLAAVRLWEKMREHGGGGSPQFLSTHPSYDTRIEDLRRYAQRVRPFYEQSRR